MVKESKIQKNAPTKDIAASGTLARSVSDRSDSSTGSITRLLSGLTIKPPERFQPFSGGAIKKKRVRKQVKRTPAEKIALHAANVVEWQKKIGTAGLAEEKIKKLQRKVDEAQAIIAKLSQRGAKKLAEEKVKVKNKGAAKKNKVKFAEKSKAKAKGKGKGKGKGAA